MKQVIFAVFLLAQSGCAFRDDKTTTGTVPSITQLAPAGTAVTFSALKASVFTSYGCIGCHPANGNAAFNISNYNSTVTTEVSVGNSAASNVYTKCTSSPPFGGRMPPGGPYLNATELQALADWINNGAPP